MKTDNTKTRYILYCRKSTDSEDRQVLSLNDQKAELEDIEKRENLKVVERFAGDKGGESHTAFKRGRPIFNHVIQQTEAGIANALLVWHVNRIARNAWDGGQIITLMDEGKLLEVKTPSRTYYNNPDDKFFLQLEFGMAKKSSDDSSVVIKRALKTKLRLGWFPSQAKLGYLNTKVEDKGKNTIINDPERFYIIKQAWQMFLTGNYTVMAIKKWGDKQALTTRPTKKRPQGNHVSRSTWYRILTDPFYYGYFLYGKEQDNQLYKGAHIPMITPEEFDRVQIILGRKGKPRPKKHIFAFTGLMKCSCGAGVTAEQKVKRQLNGNVHQYIYYHCTRKINPDCTEKSIELKKLNQQIDATLEKLTISEKFQDWAMKYLHEIRQNEAQSNETALANKQRTLSQIAAQIDALLLKYTLPENSSGKLISDSEYQTLKDRLLNEKANIESDLNDHSRKMDEWVELGERTFNFARYARLWFARGDLETKRAVFACLGSHLLLKDQKVAITLRKPFEFIFENKETVERELSKVRTPKNVMKTKQFADFWANCPNLRRVQDSNLQRIAPAAFQVRCHTIRRTLH